MKKIVFFIIIGIFSLQGIFAQTNFKNSDGVFEFYENYAGKEGFTTVYITAKMFQLFASMEMESEDPDTEEVMNIASKLEGIRILVFDNEEEDEDGNIIKKSLTYTPRNLYQEVATKLPSNYYEDLMIVKSDGTDVKFMINESRPGIINELLMLVGGPDTFVFMSIAGEINLKNISKLSNSVDIEGLDYLEALDDDNSDKKIKVDVDIK